MLARPGTARRTRRGASGRRHPRRRRATASASSPAATTGGVVRHRPDGSTRTAGRDQGRLDRCARAQRGRRLRLAAGKRVHRPRRQGPREDAGALLRARAASPSRPRATAWRSATTTASPCGFPTSRPSREFLEWKGSHIDVTWSPDGRFVVTSMQENALHGWRLRPDKGHMRMTRLSVEDALPLVVA